MRGQISYAYLQDGARRSMGSAPTIASRLCVEKVLIPEEARHERSERGYGHYDASIFPSLGLKVSSHEV